MNVFEKLPKNPFYFLQYKMAVFIPILGAAVLGIYYIKKSQPFSKESEILRADPSPEWKKVLADIQKHHLSSLKNVEVDKNQIEMTPDQELKSALLLRRKIIEASCAAVVARGSQGP